MMYKCSFSAWWCGRS